MNKLFNNQKGFTALFSVITFSLLIVTISVSAGRISSSELRKSSNIDLSSRADAAADAGIEEAFHRLEQYEDLDIPLDEIFPEEDAGSRGDYAILVSTDGSEPPLDVVSDNGQPNGPSFTGLEYWEQRRVYTASFDESGIQQKDESVQIDLSDLGQLDVDGDICDNNNLACDGVTPIHPSLDGFTYCVVNRADIAIPQFEWTITEYSPTNPQDISPTQKFLVDYSGTVQQALGASAFNISNEAGRPGERCFRYSVPDRARRYIIRIKPLYRDSLANLADQDEYRVTYNLKLNHTVPGGKIVVVDQSVVVDVTGVAGNGDVAIRKIAKKDRNGRLLGIFDFVLYSGDPTFPLCKAGVLYDPDDDGVNDISYNLETCTDNSSSSTNVIEGCTDPAANNPTPGAQVDNGSCDYGVSGCTQPHAINYNPAATINSGCTYTPNNSTVGPYQPDFKIQASQFSPGFNSNDGTADGGGMKPLPQGSIRQISYTYTGSSITYNQFMVTSRSSGDPRALTVRNSSGTIIAIFNVSTTSYQSYSIDTQVNPGDTFTLEYQDFRNPGSSQIYIDYAGFNNPNPSNLALGATLARDDYTRHSGYRYGNGRLRVDGPNPYVGFYNYNAPGRDYERNYLTDGNHNTMWYAATNGTSTATIDLGRSADITEIKSIFRNFGCSRTAFGFDSSCGGNYVQRYVLEISNSYSGTLSNSGTCNLSGGSWRTLVNQSTPPGPEPTWTGNETARYVRVCARAGFDWWGMYEIEVKGT